MRVPAAAAVENRRMVHVRIGHIRASVRTAFSLPCCGFLDFQSLQQDKVQEMAENNHQRTLPLRAPRGAVFDRHGEILVENRASFNISIMREHTRDLERTVRLLSSVV